MSAKVLCVSCNKGIHRGHRGKTVTSNNNKQEEKWEHFTGPVELNTVKRYLMPNVTPSDIHNVLDKLNDRKKIPFCPFCMELVTRIYDFENEIERIKSLIDSMVVCLQTKIQSSLTNDLDFGDSDENLVHLRKLMCGKTNDLTSSTHLQDELPPVVKTDEDILDAVRSNWDKFQAFTFTDPLLVKFEPVIPTEEEQDNVDYSEDFSPQFYMSNPASPCSPPMTVEATFMKVEHEETEEVADVPESEDGGSTSRRKSARVLSQKRVRNYAELLAGNDDEDEVPKKRQKNRRPGSGSPEDFREMDLDEKEDAEEGEEIVDPEWKPVDDMLESPLVDPCHLDVERNEEEGKKKFSGRRGRKPKSKNHSRITDDEDEFDQEKGTKKVGRPPTGPEGTPKYKIRKTNRKNRTVTKLGPDHYEFHGYRYKKVDNGNYICEHCPSILKTRDSALVHVKRVHLGENDFGFYLCPICGKSFKSRMCFRTHSSIHSDVRKYVCEYCGKGFKQKSNLLGHRIMHEKDLEFVCTIEGCNRRFLRPKQLKFHVMRHKGERPFECTICHKKYIQRSEMNHHMKVVHEGNRLKCPLCVKTLGTVSHLKRHLRNVHKQESETMKDEIGGVPVPDDIQEIQVEIITGDFSLVDNSLACE